LLLHDEKTSARDRDRGLVQGGTGVWFAFLIEIMYSDGQMMQRGGGFGK
jgi:hypothetical protein